MQKITPNLWFDTEAEEAADFYISVFKNSRIVHKTHYTEAGPRPAGTVMTVGGLSWQVTPTGMDEVFSDPDPERARRAMEAMLGMGKIDIEALRRAADGVPAT